MRKLLLGCFFLLSFIGCTDPEPQLAQDPCEETKKWCPATFVWTEDPTGRCYCPCNTHEVCELAPEKSTCGVLLSEEIRFFPKGFPTVCRIVSMETEVP